MIAAREVNPEEFHSGSAVADIGMAVYPLCWLERLYFFHNLTGRKTA